MKDADKPQVLRQPRRLLRIIFVLLVLGIVYTATALKGFLRNQAKEPDPRMTGSEAPLERVI